MTENQFEIALSVFTKQTHGMADKVLGHIQDGEIDKAKFELVQWMAMTAPLLEKKGNLFSTCHKLIQIANARAALVWVFEGRREYAERKR